jgi:RhtB (resistance to homoserine/threonine) family protein
MEYLPEFLTVATIHLLAVMSPGPDFILVTRNSLMYSRRTGIYTAIGLGFGILLHVTYSLVGIGLIISQSILLFAIIKFIGAGYLLYIGYKSLTAKASHVTVSGEKRDRDIDTLSAIKMGFICNATNPKATIFFLSIFTQVINPHTPLFVQLLYCIEMTVVTSAWFMLIATVFSHGYLRQKVAGVQQYTERFMGAILMLLGIRLALTSAK